MKKLWKHEWKYYGIALLVVICVIIFGFNFGMLDGDYLGYGEDIVDYILYDNLYMFTWDCSSVGLYRIEYCLMITMIILKIGCNIASASNSGREFMEQLPVTKGKRQQFHIIMNLMLVTIAILVTTFYLYLKATKLLAEVDIQIEWLGSALVGQAVTVFAYLVLLYGFFTLIENVIVNGFGRIVGIIVGLIAGSSFLNLIYRLEDKNIILKKIYDILYFDAPGSWNFVRDINMYDGGWYPNAPDVPYYYGETLKEINDCNCLTSLYYCSQINIVLERIIPYLLIGILLLTLAYYLGKRQEASKQGFYFVTAKYVVAIIIGISFSLMCISSFPYIWYKCVVILASICVAGIFAYWMTPDRSRPFAQKVKTKIE